ARRRGLRGLHAADARAGRRGRRELNLAAPAGWRRARPRDARARTADSGNDAERRGRPGLRDGRRASAPAARRDARPRGDLRPTRASAADRARRAARGRDPGDADCGRLGRMKLSAEQPYGDAAATVIRERTQAVFAHRRKAVLDLGDIEGVHAMRVASRRLRAALEVFEPCLHRKRGARALADVKALARALGERRDRDVGLDLLTGLLATCPPAERRAVEVLIEDLRR